MARRFQFSLQRLLTAIALFALALGLLRAAFDSGRGDVALVAMLAQPIILGAAVGRLFGGAAKGVVIVAMIYWLLGVSVLGIAAVGAMVSQLAKWIR